MNITPHFSRAGKLSSWRMAYKFTAEQSKPQKAKQTESVDTYEAESRPNISSRDFFTQSKQLRTMALGGR